MQHNSSKFCIGEDIISCYYLAHILEALDIGNVYFISFQDNRLKVSNRKSVTKLKCRLDVKWTELKVAIMNVM